MAVLAFGALIVMLVVISIVAQPREGTSKPIKAKRVRTATRMPMAGHFFRRMILAAAAGAMVFGAVRVYDGRTISIPPKQASEHPTQFKDREANQRAERRQAFREGTMTLAGGAALVIIAWPRRLRIPDPGT